MILYVFFIILGIGNEIWGDFRVIKVIIELILVFDFCVVFMGVRKVVFFWSNGNGIVFCWVFFESIGSYEELI